MHLSFSNGRVRSRSRLSGSSHCLKGICGFSPLFLNATGPRPAQFRTAGAFDRRNSVLPVPSPADMVTTFCSIFDTARTSRNLVPFLLRQPVVAIVTMPAGEGTGSTGLGTGSTMRQLSVAPLSFGQCLKSLPSRARPLRVQCLCHPAMSTFRTLLSTAEKTICFLAFASICLSNMECSQIYHVFRP